MKNNQKGFGAIEILLLLLVLAVVGFGGYYVWNSNRENIQNNKTADQASENTKEGTGGPAPGHTVASDIKIVTGQYMPAHIDVKKGSKVTWEMTDGDTNLAKYAVESDTDSTEKFSSDDLKHGDTFSHTFNEVGVFGWHDKYNGNLVGTVTVTE
jgi:plastocyanin